MRDVISARLPVQPLGSGETRFFCTSFSEAAKQVVSGIEMQIRLSSLLYGMYGEAITMAKIALTFPFPLQKEEHIEIALALKGARRVKDTSLFLARFTLMAHCTENGRIVLKGSFLIVVPQP